MFENDNPEDREKLVEELIRHDLNAYEWNSGGGIYHVIVPIINTYNDSNLIHAQDKNLIENMQANIADWPDETYLYISTNSLQSDCEIGLMGQSGKNGNPVSSPDWKFITSLDEAAKEFQCIWEDRDEWIKKLLLET